VSAVERFIESAQIEGQLQHPGVVPVYELGVDDEGRPFFARKLVRGQTLTALLEERKSPTGDHHRLLSIFEQVCQAVAYTHARGVTHGRLSTDTILVGSFGEVQIEDWSGAKLLGPGEEGDKSGDVRALGVMLGEILTGEAAPRDLDRLRQECLATNPEQRPSDGAAVAERIGAHLAAVEERKRQSEMRTAEARARALTERKTRRLTLGLAAAVLLAVLVGGGGWLYVAGERQTREEEAGRAVATALGEARERRGEARKAEVGNLSPWTAAKDAVLRAVDVAETGGAAAGVTEEARGLLAEIEVDLGVAADVAEQHGRDQAMVPRLERVRLIGRRSAKLTESEDDFVAAFREYGIDVDALDEREVALRIGKSAIAGDLVAALDKWSWVRRRLGGREDEKARRLLRIIQASDEDPDRIRIRELADEEDREGLKALARTSPSTREASWLLALHLGHLREHDEAIALLRRAQVRHPDDFWLAYQLGRELTVLNPPRWKEAVAMYQASLALRPDSLEVRHRLAFAMENAGALDGALSLWWDTLRQDPEPFVVYQHIVAIHEKRETLDLALVELEKKCRENSQDAWPWLARGLVYLVRGEYEEAVRVNEEATRLSPESAIFWVYLGDSVALTDGPVKAREAFERGVELDPNLARAWARLSFSWILEGNFDEAAKAAKKATDVDPKKAGYWAGYGQTLRLGGRTEEALTKSLRAVALEPDHHVYRCELAWTYLNLGEYEKSLQAARTAQRLYDLEPEGRFNMSFRKVYDPKKGEHRRVARLGWRKLSDNAWNVACFSLEGMGDLDGARDEVRKAIAINPENWFPHHMLGYLEMRRGDFVAAIEPMESAIRLRPNYIWNRYFLGLASLGAGQFDKAREMLLEYYLSEPWLEGWTVEREEWEKDLEILIRQARRLDELLEDPPADRRERTLFVWLLHELGRNRAAAGLSEKWLREDPELGDYVMLWPGPERFRFEAATALMLAGGGFGVDVAGIDDAERSRMRLVALSLFDRNWSNWVARWKTGPPETALHLRYAADVRLTNAAFKMVQAESNLRKLPDEEAASWRRLWSRIRADRELAAAREK